MKEPQSILSVFREQVDGQLVYRAFCADGSVWIYHWGRRTVGKAIQAVWMWEQER